MKKQIKKTNARQTKRLQLDKTAISSFDAKQVKGGTRIGRTTVNAPITMIHCIQYTRVRDCE